MSRIFISDVHIGDNYSGVRDVAPFLEKQDDVDEIVLLGDIFDFWVSSLDRKEHAEDLARLLMLTKKYGKVTWVAGNHDAEIWPLSEFCDIERYYLGTGPYIAIHGHEQDPADYEILKANNHALARFINWSNGKFKYDMRRWLPSVSRKTNSVRLLRIREIYHRIDVTYGGRFKWLVMGHTHNPCIMEMDSGLFILDCGDWREHRTAVKELDDSFQLLDFETGEIVVKQQLDK